MSAQGIVCVPARGFTRAKRRLRGVLDDGERAALARRLFEHVLGVVGEAAPGYTVLTLTDCDDVAALARSRGSEVRRDRADEQGPGMVLRAVAGELRGTALMVVMADLPTLCAGDLGAVLDAAHGLDAVFAPDGAALGTNVAWWRSPAPELLSFGCEDSLIRHEALARREGLRHGRVVRAGTSLDIDLPEDLSRWLGPLAVRSPLAG